MKIKSFSFSNNTQNWQIEEVHFDDLNLLVGASGVGKTRILRALELICGGTRDKEAKLENMEWSIRFSHLKKDYKWELKTSNSADDTFLGELEQAEILYEKLTEFRGNDEVEILYRTNTESRLNNEKLPKLKRTESAITLLVEEDSIAPIAEAFKRFIFNETSQEDFFALSFDPNNVVMSFDIKRFKEFFVGDQIVVKAYLIQEFFPDLFNDMKEVYVDIFPSVKDVRVAIDRESNKYVILFEIQEYGSEDWISQEHISSGMYRTLTYLLEILSAPEESVIMIDEFENSLGINCMPELTDFILEKSPNLQFILTSHHPYIINNIPWKTWQVVSRTNGKIRVRKAIDIPALDTASSLDKFTQLINLLEYEDEAA
jgi:AAA domain, putative AbiEii toxin, Type IV TA system